MFFQKQNVSFIDIDIYIGKLEDLYADNNYSSIMYKAINPYLEKYIINAVKKYSQKSNLRLIFHIPIDEIGINSIELKHSFYNHFKYKVKDSDIYLQQKFRRWKINICIGAILLAACFAILELFNKKPETNSLKILKESLLIMVWVALWDPITFLLFGWSPLLKNKLIFEKLSTIPIYTSKYISNRKNGSQLK